MRKFLDELATIHLIPYEIDLHKPPSEQKFRRDCRDNISSFFMKACAAISPEMEEDFRRQQELQEKKRYVSKAVGRHNPCGEQETASTWQTNKTHPQRAKQKRKARLNFLLI